MTHLLIVEDTEIVASGIRMTIEGAEENHVVAVVPSVVQAEGFLRSRPIDVVVVDVRLEDGTAFDLMRKVADIDPAPAFLIVSSFDLVQYVDAALRLGASGYILKTAPTSELLGAVTTVAAGGWAFDPDLVRKTGAAKQLTLSERDRQVIDRLVAGRSNDEIGTDLNISRKTVEAHLSKLYVKFDASTRVDLVRRAEREQWLESPTSDRA
ncbi:MAG: response regulator transcription factor [Chloroflexi bacterium]|jgi:DNA-binding NarL/FixJ family response regulator|nr:response regulator transcription factor [Chloroflexota bacterium]